MESPLQEVEQTQEPKRTYENKDYIHLHDFQVTERTNSETGQPFWTCKLAKGTFIEHEGQRMDVSGYLFSTNQEPLVIHGEPGEPKCMRSVHFPDGWSLDLRRYENTAEKGQPPVFKEANRIEGVSPKQIADGVRERNETWRNNHGLQDGKADRSQEHAGKSLASADKAIRKRSDELSV